MFNNLLTCSAIVSRIDPRAKSLKTYNFHHAKDVQLYPKCPSRLQSVDFLNHKNSYRLIFKSIICVTFSPNFAILVFKTIAKLLRNTLTEESFHPFSPNDLYSRPTHPTAKTNLRIRLKTSAFTKAL